MSAFIISKRAALLHLFALTTLAIAQPLFDLLGVNPQFFLIRDAGPREIIFFIVVVWALPWIALASLFLLSQSLNKRLGQWVFLQNSKISGDLNAFP